VAAKAEKFGKQIKFADRRGIPFVWFTDEHGRHQVKDIRSGVQVDADPASWSPSDEDLSVQVTTALEASAQPA
jgi:histidyl-tRNA synthetase